MPRTVLVVDEDPITRGICRMVLSSAGYCVLEAADGLAGLQTARLHRPDLVSLEHPSRLPRGGDLLTALRAVDGPPVRILIVSRWMEELAGTGKEDLFERSLSKPFHPDRYLEAVKDLIGPPDDDIQVSEDPATPIR